jgi:hypothetical protein
MSDEIDPAVLSDGRCRLALHRPRAFPQDGLEHLVTAAAGPFEGKLTAVAWLNSYAKFCDDLEALHHRLTGEAVLQGYENLELRLHGDGLGHVEAAVAMVADHVNAIELRFRIELDQTQLPALIASLRRIFVEQR